MGKRARTWAIRLAVLGAVAAIPLGVIVLSAVQDRLPSYRPEQPLRLSGGQFLMNWQSFPARAATIEYCTIQVEAGRRIACLVFDGGRRLGEIGIDGDTLDEASRAWAEKNCSQATSRLACSVRLSGVIARGSGAQPMLDRAKILF